MQTRYKQQKIIYVLRKTFLAMLLLIAIFFRLNKWNVSYPFVFRSLGWYFLVLVLLHSVRVSNELGSRHPRAAKYSVFVTVAESLLIGIFCSVAIMTTRNHFAIIFTDSKEMQKAVAHLAYLLAITMVLNSVQPVISGINIHLIMIDESWIDFKANKFTKKFLIIISIK